MNYIHKTQTFASSDGIHSVYADFYIPRNTDVVGVVQLAHGMVDHPGRYTNLIEFLTSHGIALAAHHHLGHGKTAINESELGYFAKRDGWKKLIEDMHGMNKLIRSTFEGVRIAVLGHSMGSFITRLYVAKYPNDVCSTVIHGTSGPNHSAPFGKLLARLLILVQGENYRSGFVTRVAFANFNADFDKSEGKLAWLTRDAEQVKNKRDDKYANFSFTLSAYCDLFELLIRSNRQRWYDSYPKDMPTLIVSGDMDPVGNHGKGPCCVYKRLKMAGCTDVSLKLYEGARHELFNETNREEVFEHLLTYFDRVFKVRV